ncbi:MFS transporter [Sandarakinorhabdus sp. AAP62]|uniref:MFS transporter n=1 Tax=Sandarakinorhabdus sp. AAP62 TaxID=1248916 RepID=UPI0003138954|nr:MFS transporter [Sandarakinorhabdus sp. AAP62]
MADAVAPRRFLLLYALAWAGAAIAYVPFLTILLPVKVEGLAGTSVGVDWLAWLSFGGAMAASAGHLLFGWLSDLSGRRRPWIAAGLLLSCLLLLAMGQANSLDMLLVLIVAWQLALNMMMAPLAALAGDHVPDDQKGLLGGLLAFAPGLGALSGALVTWPDLMSPQGRLALVAALVAGTVLPILLLPLPGRTDPAPLAKPAPPLHPAATVRRMWLARLALQIAEATLFAYLYFWFVAVDADMTDNRVAGVFAAALVVSAPVTLAAGRWADRHGQPFRPLVLAALGAFVGLVAMALAQGLVAAAAAFALFSLASAVFLALHSAQTLRVLPRPDRRGRDLGLFNLTNTIPSLIMPWITVGLVPRFGFSGLFAALAVLCLTSALVLASLSRRD